MSDLTPKQERFALVYIETSNASEAYRRAYPGSEKWTPESLHSKASNLLATDKVRARIEELQAQHVERHQITVDSLTEMAVAAYKLAMKDGVEAPAAAISAVLAIGKLHGLIVDKKEVTRKRDAADLTDDELVALALLGRERTTSPTRGSNEPDRLH